MFAIAPAVTVKRTCTVGKLSVGYRHTKCPTHVNITKVGKMYPTTVQAQRASATLSAHDTQNLRRNAHSLGPNSDTEGQTIHEIERFGAAVDRARDDRLRSVL